MSKIFVLLFSVSVALVLSSCASVTTNISSTENVSEQQVQQRWQQRQQQLSNLPGWQMKGRMVVVNGVELWAMSVDWEQRGDQYVIFLSGPFGAGKIQLAGSANGVLLRDSDNQVFYASTPEELLLDHTGIAMPLIYLRFWILGLLQSGSNLAANKVKFDKLGRLKSLSTEQWDVRFKRYTKVENLAVELPDKIFIHKGDDLEVRIVVGEWLFGRT